jgi:hypothetical protein
MNAALHFVADLLLSDDKEIFNIGQVHFGKRTIKEQEELLAYLKKGSRSFLYFRSRDEIRRQRRTAATKHILLP